MLLPSDAGHEKCRAALTAVACRVLDGWCSRERGNIVNSPRSFLTIVGCRDGARDTVHC